MGLRHVVISGGGVITAGGGYKGNFELEFGEEGAREVRVFLAGAEHDAVEFILGDGDGPVGCVFPGGEVGGV